MVAQQGWAGGRFEVLGGSCPLQPPVGSCCARGVCSGVVGSKPKCPRSEHGARWNRNAAVGGTGWSFKFIVQKSECHIQMDDKASYLQPRISLP